MSSSTATHVAPPPEWVVSFYSCLDSKDAHGLAAKCTEDVAMRLGSDETVIGRADMVAKLTRLLGAHASMKHEILRTWETDEAALIEIKATHGLPNGETPSAPAFAVLTRRDGLVCDIRTFLDRTAFSETAGRAVATELGYGA